MFLLVYLKEYISSLPFPPILLEEKYPVLSVANTTPKSSAVLFKNNPSLRFSNHLPSIVFAEKISKSPNPGKPLEEKNKIPSFLINGNNSSPLVLMSIPRFTGFPQVSPLRLVTHISCPPCPPGISDAKYIVFPSLLILGCAQE